MLFAERGSFGEFRWCMLFKLDEEFESVWMLQRQNIATDIQSSSVLLLKMN